LLPASPPAIAGAEIAFTNLPANTVSGDFYDAFFRNERLLFTVADVAGKGLPAALLTATFQASLRTLAAEPHDLAELMLGLNRYASNASQGGTRFTTAFLAELDPARGNLEAPRAERAPVAGERSHDSERPQGATQVRGGVSTRRHLSPRSPRSQLAVANGPGGSWR
ncbi:MAG: PP2C family protein-serine/threonine phosphatase, partial [Terriglobales bacterium]